jgi:hypothetical protein
MANVIFSPATGYEVAVEAAAVPGEDAAAVPAPVIAPFC